MSEEQKTEQKQETQLPEELSDILLVYDKEKMRLQAVKGIDKKGELQTVDPTKQNQDQFMRVDKGGDIFSNFFSNFFHRLNNPKQFSFFKIPFNKAVETAKAIQKQFDNPTKEGADLIEKHLVTEPTEQKKENNMETAQTTQTANAQPGTEEKNEYKYKPEQIDWETMSNLGLSREKLEKRNLLEPLLKGYKTNELISVSANLGTTVLRSDARLSLQLNKEGQVIMNIHGVRREPDFSYPYLGHVFTPEDKANLSTTGNMGRIVELTNPKNGEKTPSLISVDRLTNELIAYPSKFITIPDELKGVKLNEEQKRALFEGKPVFVDGMISNKDKPFSTYVQFNADKRGVEFLFDRTKMKSQIQQNEKGLLMEAPRSFRGKELTDEQYQKYNNGQAVFLEGIIDKKGQPYNGYATFNKENGKEDFSFGDPNKLKDKIQPKEENKTQVDVNSNGKTNEATKNINEPLKSGQQNPNSQAQKNLQDKKPVKSKARKL